MTNSDAPKQIPIYKRLRVQTLSFGDLRSAFASGCSDFARSPIKSASFGLVYSLGGIFILAGLIHFGEPWMIIPVAVGFPLVGPFVSASLYEISKRRPTGEDIAYSSIFRSVLKRKEIAWMAFVVLFVFWLWIYQVRILLAIFLGSASLKSLGHFWTTITTTFDGFMFLGVGSIVGAVLSTILFSLTVVSMPLLLDRDVDFITAMIYSVRTVLTNPVVMLSWGVFVALLAFLAMIPAFLGLILILPILGHATWHLYLRAIKVLSPEELQEN